MLVIRRHVAVFITRWTRQVADWVLRVRVDLRVEILGANGNDGLSVGFEDSTGGAEVGEKLSDWDVFIFQNTRWRNKVVLQVDDKECWSHVFSNFILFGCV